MRVPFQALASGLPKEVLLLANPGVGGDFEFSTAMLVPQLASGSIKVTFSELRAAAPAGLFRGNPSMGDIEISLPLAAIVPCIDPAKLSRRAPVKRWDAPPEISNLFGPKGAPIKPAESFFAESQPAPAPVAQRPAAAAPAKPAAPVPAPAPSSSMPTATTVATATDTLEIPLSQLATLWPAAITNEIRGLGVGGHPVRLPVSQIEPALRSGKVCFAWQQIAAWIHPQPAAVSPATAGTLLDLPLKLIAPLFVARFKARENQKRVNVGEDIPDVFGNASAAPAAPAAPAPVSAAPPVHHEPVVEKKPPTPVVVAATPPPAEDEAPLVVEHTPPPAVEPIKMPSISMPVREPAPVAVAPAPEPKSEPAAPVPAASRLGALFGNPQKADWSPAEIVQKVAAFPGVTGAVIALPEGLPVAAQLPSSVNADAFAGFMPQMFARIAQYTRELKFGEINKLSLEVNGGHVTVFRAGRVYFGVVGEGATSPAAQLALVATELSKLNP